VDINYCITIAICYYTFGHTSQPPEEGRPKLVTSIIARNQSLSATPFSMFHLPPLVPGTDGIAIPKPGTTAVLCIAPGSATTYNESWGQEFTLNPGDPHLAIASDDTYPNQIFNRDYVVIGAVTSSNTLGEVLREFWVTRGFGEDDFREAWLRYLAKFSEPLPPWLTTVRQLVSQDKYFFLAKKEQPAIVRGVVDLRILTSEGPTRVEHGSVLLEHPDDPTNQWLARAEKFAQRYDWVRAPTNGLFIPNTN
jgi:hypothetical protein